MRCPSGSSPDSNDPPEKASARLVKGRRPVMAERSIGLREGNPKGSAAERSACVHPLPLELDLSALAE
jgi:hypothetical protein